MKPTGRPFWILCFAVAVFGASLLLAIDRHRRVFESRLPETAAARRDDRKIFAQYRGSQSCRDCHRRIFEQWIQSNHGLAERSIRPELDKRAFDPPRSIAHGTQTSWADRDQSRYQVTTLGFTGRVEPHPVERVIGNSPLRQFLTPAPGGRWQALELAFDPGRNEWFDIYGAEERKPGDWGHWTGRGMNWNSMCATCHNTRLRKNYIETTDTYQTAMAEMSVGCEACHGPMKAHLDWQRTSPRKPDPTARKLTRDQMLDTCGACHSRRMELTGDFRPGDSFFDHFALTIPDETDTYYADGQVQEEDYEFASFLGSRMFGAGVRCVDCHDPHSGKTMFPGNALCMRCHNGSNPKSPRIDPLAHTFHKPNGPGAECVNCHMPQTVYMQRHRRHDHGFTIPDPLLTRDRGIPNACNRCHAREKTEWALATVEKWYGMKMDRPARRRAQLISSARAGDDSARDLLVAFLKNTEASFWKAVAATLLERWVTHREAKDALVCLVNSPDPLLRASVVRSLAALAERGGWDIQRALSGGLADAVRSVRFTAAWATRRTLDPSSRAGKEFLSVLQNNADQPGGQLQKGIYYFERQEPEKALACLEKAVKWDPNSAPFHEELAVVLSSAGRAPEALAQMQAACRLNPNDAEYQFRLGLAWNEAGEADQAGRALEQAVRLNPRHARAWYNLGLIQNLRGQPDDSLESLLRAESADPEDALIPYARATILLRLGSTDKAKAAAHRALEIDPQFSAARDLLNSMP